MALTNAERQRLWRERQKAKNKDAFLLRERKRNYKYYIPVAALNDEQLRERRAATKARVQNHYRSIKLKKKDTVSPPVIRTRKHGRLVVKLTVPTRTKRSVGIRKTYCSSLRKAHRNITKLSLKQEKLLKANRCLQKRLERMRKRNINSTTAATADVLNMTPDSKTKAQLNDSGLERHQYDRIRKQLLLSNALIEDIKQDKSNPLRKMACKIVKKYRCLSSLCTKVGIHRRQLGRTTHIVTGRKRLAHKMKDTVKTFLDREDNSAPLPGKRDTKRVNGEIKQKRILSDYIYNLHEKFNRENPLSKVSRSLFYQLVPANYVHVSFASRNKCLCNRHQNMALKMKALRNVGLLVPKNPDQFIKEHDTDEKTSTLVEKGVTAETIRFTQWKKVQDKEKYKWKEVEVTQTKVQFMDTFVNEAREFRLHVYRVQTQYAEMRKLRENLAPGHVVVWMDFSENYLCSSHDEIQSAYWNGTLVSLHTAVIYFPVGHGKTVQSVVAVSGVEKHNATAVYTILNKLIPEIKHEYAEVETIHYLTDSPLSQYRNRYIFQTLSLHESEFGINARWNYLESGHGKGPCDGLGGSVKRSADAAVTQGKCSIQDADDFYKWGKKSETDGSKVKYIYYDEDDYDRAAATLNQRPPVVPISGTLKIHAVTPHGNGVYVRDVSCNCNSCITDISKSTCQWTFHKLDKTKNDHKKETKKIKKKIQPVVVKESLNVLIDKLRKQVELKRKNVK